MAAAASKKADLSMLVSLAEEEEEDGVHDVGAQSPTPPQDAAAAGSGDRDGDGNVAPARDELSGGLASQQALSRSARSLLDGLGRAGSGANGYGEDDPDARAVVTLLSDLDVDGDAQSAAPGSLHRPPSSHVAPTLATAGGQMRPVLSVDGRESLLVRRASSRRRLPPGPELAELAIRSPGSSYLSQRRSSLGLGGEESPHDNPQRLRRDYSKIFKPGGAVEAPADGGRGTASRHDLYRPGSVGEGGARPAGPPGSLRGGIFGGESMASLATVDYGDNLLGVPDSPVANGERSMLATAGGELYLPGPPQSRWVYGRKLGEGGNSTVRLATSTIEPGVRTAVKVIDKRPDDQAHEKMVAREVFSYRLLSLAGGHEHIVELIEVGEDDTHVYMFMELLQGGELFSRISDKGQYTEKDAARLTAAMLSALAFCHRLNITHRDVKAENFVYVSAAEPGLGSSPGGTGAADNGGGSGSGARYDIKLIDFGISHYSEDPNELCNTLCGTPLYVAPEVLLRQPYGFESDMWSVGVIVYIMLVGTPPFDDSDLVQLVKKVKYRPVRFDGPEWVMISEQGKDFLMNLLDKAPGNRMPAAEALDHPWLRDSCLAAPHNALDIAQANIRKFGSRNRWRAVIQGVRALNRIQRAMNAAVVTEHPDGSVTPARLPHPAHPLGGLGGGLGGG
eukprot:contig_22975_g5671